MWKCYVLPISFFSILYNFPKFLELSVVKSNSMCPDNEAWNVTNQYCHEESQTNFTIKATSLRLNPLYVKYYLIYVNFILHAIIPLVALTILNTLIYRRVNITNISSSIITVILKLSTLHSSADSISASIHLKDVRLAHVSLVIVFVFICCHSIKWIPNMWELRQAERGKV